MVPALEAWALPTPLRRSFGRARSPLEEAAAVAAGEHHGLVGGVPLSQVSAVLQAAGPHSGPAAALPLEPAGGLPLEPAAGLRWGQLVALWLGLQPPRWSAPSAAPQVSRPRFFAAALAVPPPPARRPYKRSGWLSRPASRQRSRSRLVSVCRRASRPQGATSFPTPQSSEPHNVCSVSTHTRCVTAR